MRTRHKIPALAAVSALALTGPAAADPSFPRIGEADEKFEFVERFCMECHNFSEWAGGVAFDVMDPEFVGEDADVWEHAVMRLRGGLMPPADAPFPEDGPRFDFIEWMEAYLDHAASARVHVGHVPLHRMNRKEYANAVRDLLGIEVNAADLLPQDASMAGFDNIAEALTVSPTFLEQSLNAARAVAAQAIGDPNARAGGTVYEAFGRGDQLAHVEGLPLGTRGGMAVQHYFPADGEYELSIGNLAQALWVSNQEFTHTLIATYNGEKFFELDIGGGEDLRAIDQIGDPAVDAINARLKDIRFTAQAGPQTVAVTFLHRSYAEHEGVLSPLRPGGGIDNVLRLGSFEIRGPYEPTGLSPTPARNQIFTCYPGEDAAAAEQRACAEEIVRRMGRRAYRGNLQDSDVAEMLRAYDAGRDEGGSFDLGVRRALTVALASPKFLYRMEPLPEDVAGGDVYPLTDLELASRLSFFLWSSIPDDELLDAAEAGRLGDPQVLEAQTRRMLADPRARSLTDNFAYQWLHIAHLDEVNPDPEIFADVPGNIRDLFVRELMLFIDDVFSNDRDVTELLHADYSYLNEDLALHYDIHDVKGDRFRRVTLDNSTRHGLTGKGALLMSAAYPDRTAPVLRGAYVLEHIIGTPPAPPPPDVEALIESAPGERVLTVRERMALHSADPTCNSCHGLMDALGFALENFDAVARWREIDRFARVPIDSAAVMPNGKPVDGPDDLRAALLERPDQFVQTIAHRMMIFALGRTLDHNDMPTVRAIVREAENQDYRFSALVLGVVNSDQFKMKSPAESDIINEAALR